MFQRLANTLALTTLGTLIATTAIAQNKTDIAWGGSNPGGVMYYMVGVAGTELGKDLPDVNITLKSDKDAGFIGDGNAHRNADFIGAIACAFNQDIGVFD